ncbi:YraN family protein [Terrisporobacter glycolicus]|uniref:YraN family protein n=1 Tax=Terrisporobacter petrolearius TaxID=1460447 RepID=UPI0011DCB8D1
MNNIEKGKLGEEIALKYIISKGGKVIEKNYRTKIGEVDIIAKLNGELVFVEVKSRSNINYGYPSESVNYKKKRKITNVAKYYIIDNSLENLSIRFDVIEIYFNEKKINHIVNAF